MVTLLMPEDYYGMPAGIPAHFPAIPGSPPCTPVSGNPPGAAMVLEDGRRATLPGAGHTSHGMV